jgi:hypothetical protein
MSKEQESAADLCKNEGRLGAAIKLFNDIFKFDDDLTLSYFFDKDELIKLMKDPKCKGIKVFPALEDDRDEREISITMVVKPFPEIKSSDDYLHNEQDDPAFKVAPAICCPTPGRPFVKKRKERLKHWIHKLVDLL